MSVADDHAVTSRDKVFHHAQHAVSDCFARVHEHVRRAVDQLIDDDALALDPQTWAVDQAAELAVEAPRINVDGHEFVNEGRIQVDCTGWPGVSYSLTEYGRGVLRDGHRFSVNVPGDGDLQLLRSRLARGGTGRKADVSREAITRVYEWPQVLAAAELQADVDDFLADLRTGAEEIARQVDERNAQLVDLAAGALADRQQKIRESRGYLGDLRLTVTRNPEAETIIPALPAPLPQPGRRSPRTATAQPPARDASLSERPAVVVDRPTLDQFYDHVVRVIGAVAVGFERSPRRFADAEEETLRDFILVTLNSHYEGAATGETFNATGKTDIIVRHGMDNAFIGECKIWGGKAKLDDTFDQLLGYTTWQDNRLALIFFVRTKKLQPVLTTAQDVLGARPEFGAWQPDAPDGQLQCSLRWEDQARKEGRLTVFMVHLPT